MISIFYEHQSKEPHAEGEILDFEHLPSFKKLFLLRLGVLHRSTVDRLAFSGLAITRH